MKKHASVAVIAAAVLLAGAAGLEAQEAGPEALIGRARAVTLSPGRIETVRKMMGDGVLFEDKIRQYLGLAYKLVSGGNAWAVPEELASAYREAEIMDRAKKICVALLDGALAAIEAGRLEAAVRDLVGFVLFVVTPVEA
ncbi:MAG: hypothetical protein MUE80_06350 [Acidobacteria bacterium]|nr:hypothetical protein [Acidobacteriota bacterium]